MSKLYTFAKVIAKDSRSNELYGPMIVTKILTDEEATFYGSFEIVCRSLSNGQVRDFREDELLVVED